MKYNLTSSDPRIQTGQLAEGLRLSLNSNCGRIFENARNLWDRNFAGKEASDACVHVRISGYTRATFESFQSSRDQYTSIAA